MRLPPYFASVSLLLVACSGNTSPPSSGDRVSGDQGLLDGGAAQSAAASGTAEPQKPPVGNGTNPAWGAACAPPGASVGFELGDSLGDLGIKDCDTGAAATVDEVCGADAAWIFAAHTHCPTCQATAAFTDDVAKAVSDKNVAVIQLVYDDNGTSCAEWRANYALAGISNVRVYADPGGKAFGKLKSSNFTAASAFINANRVVTHKEHGLTKTKVLSQVEAALKSNVR